MSEFINRLEKMNKNDTRVRAVLQRSLAFEPGEFVQAYPYIEPFLTKTESRWRRQMFYLVAGLWAAHWRDGQKGNPISLGKACAAQSSSTSTERRFIALLDADPSQLPNRLRQMTALLKEQVIDFDSLLKGLLYWNDEQKRTQNAWARDFYQGLDYKIATENQNEKELSE